MKKIIALLLIAMWAGCASGPMADRPPQEIILKIESDTPVKVDQDQIMKSMEVPNEQGKLSQLSFLDGEKAYVKIFSSLSTSDVTRIWNDFVLFKNRGVKEIILFINSGGGDAFSGLALADEIERVQRCGINITAHASGIIASAAVPVLAVCKTRFAAPGTIFMVHEAAIWKWPGRETASDIRSQNELMRILRDRYMEKLESHSKMARSKWEEMEGKITWFDAKQAKEYGLIDEIE